MENKTKQIVIGICVVLFALLLVFAVFAGIRIGADIGEFLYNKNH